MSDFVRNNGQLFPRSPGSSETSGSRRGSRTSLESDGCSDVTGLRPVPAVPSPPIGRDLEQVITTNSGERLPVL